MLVVWASGFAADITADFTDGKIPSGWTKTGTTQKNADYGTQLQKNASVTSPAFTEIIKTITINLTRSGNGTDFTVGYIKNGQTTVFKTFKSGDVTVKSLKDYKIEVPIEAQISGVKFVFTSIKSSYYVKTITFSSGVNKTVTTLTFPQSAIYIEGGNEANFKGQTATLKADKIVLNKTITYAKSGDDIFATFDATTGAATLKSGVYGTATVIATYEGDDTYAKAESSYTVTIKNPNVIETTYDFVNNSYGYERTAKLKNGDVISNGSPVSIVNTKNGTQTPSTFTDDDLRNYKNAVLTINAKEGCLISKITMTGLRISQLNLNDENGTWNKTTGEWTGSTASVSFTNPGGGTNSVCFSTITIEYSTLANTPLPLDENAEADVTNAAIKAAAESGKVYDVTLTRTLTANVWNTICLPFDVTAEQIADVLKSAGNVKEFDRENASKQTIYFKDATTMVAGVPYLIKPTESATEFVFKGVKITATKASSKGGDYYAVYGIFGKYPMNTNGTELFLTTKGKFAVPAPTTNVMRGFRAYFYNINGSTAGAALNLSFGEATGIDGVAVDAVKNVKIYNVNGQYVGTNLEALPKGLYVVGGKKVLK